MIEIEAHAREKILELLQAKDRQGKALRVQIRGRGADGFEYSLRFVDPAERQEADELLAFGDFDVLIDAESAPKLEGASIRYVENAYQQGFRVENPNPVFDDPLAQSVHEVIVSRINPAVAAHGGYVTLLDVRGGTAYVALGGGCQGCGLAEVTLKQGIDVMIKEAVPQINAVIDTTDHAAGTNPFYQPAKGGAPAQGNSPLSR